MGWIVVSISGTEVMAVGWLGLLISSIELVAMFWENSICTPIVHVVAVTPL